MFAAVNAPELAAVVGYGGNADAAVHMAPVSGRVVRNCEVKNGKAERPT